MTSRSPPSAAMVVSGRARLGKPSSMGMRATRSPKASASSPVGKACASPPDSSPSSIGKASAISTSSSTGGTGQSFLLEVNARFWANVLSCSVAGVNFPLLMCLASLGRAPQHWPTQIDGTFYCYPRGIPRLLSSRGNLRRFARHPLLATGSDQILRDPFPEVYKARRKLCRVFSRLGRDRPRTLQASRADGSGRDAGTEWHDSTGSAHIPR